MAFCTHGMKAAKDILHKLTEPLENIIDSVLKLTGAIINSREWPVIQGFISQLPGGTIINAVILKAVFSLTSTREVLAAPNAEIALKLFMEDIQKLDPLHQHALLIKLASILTAAIHGAEIASGNIEGEEVHSESTYDSLTQLKAVVINAEVKKQAA